MKKPLLILILFFFVKISYCQKKKDNVILIHGNVTYRDLKQKLFDSGFLEQSNDSIFIRTSEKPMGFLAKMHLVINRNDTATLIKGFWNADINGTSIISEIDPTSPPYFKEMKKFAEKFNLPITYLKQ